MAVPLARGARTPPRPPVFKGGNAAWWRGLITGQSRPGKPGIPKPVAANSQLWKNYGAGLGAAVQNAQAGAKSWGDYMQQQMGGYNPQINVGGGGYGGMIGGDWEVQGAESEMNARMGRARGDFQSQLRQSLIDLGVTDTSKLGSFGQYIDQATIQKAAENKYSAVAQSQQAENRARAQSEADLAARGLLSSGQLTSNAENILAEGEQQRFGALRNFLGSGQQGLTQLADLNDQLASGVAQARYAAAARAADMYQYGMGDPGFEDYGSGFDYSPQMAPPQQARRAMPQGMLRGPSGNLYYTQSRFNQVRPQGNYQNYLNYIRRARGGRL